jgi:beta-lactamase class D
LFIAILMPALASVADGKSNPGWVVGWFERDGRRWFFAVNIDMPKAGDAQKRPPLAKALLADIDAIDAPN